MKQPKFRGFGLETNQWHYGHGWFKSDYTEEYKQQKGIEDTAILYTDGYPVECELSSMGQFTGLLDSKGREIYEGDIVQVTEDPAFGGEDDFIGVVKFYECAYWIDNEPQEKACQLFNEITEHEVIGNIYENGDLLESI